MPLHGAVVGWTPAFTQPLCKHQDLKQQSPRLCGLEQVQEVGVYLWAGCSEESSPRQVLKFLHPPTASGPIYLSFRCDCVRIFWFSISFSNIIPLWSSNMSNTVILIQGSLLSFLLKFSVWLMFVNILCTWDECACTNCRVFWIYLMA